jgi:hypothetical protein
VTDQKENDADGNAPDHLCVGYDGVLNGRQTSSHVEAAGGGCFVGTNLLVSARVAARLGYPRIGFGEVAKVGIEPVVWGGVLPVVVVAAVVEVWSAASRSVVLVSTVFAFAVPAAALAVVVVVVVVVILVALLVLVVIGIVAD